MSHDISLPTEQPQHPLQRLADARRVLGINCEYHPFMDQEGRTAIRHAKRTAWAVIAEVAELLVEVLDVAAGDADLETEEDVGADDEGENRTWIETVDQRRIGAAAGASTQSHDDAEDDDPREDDGEDICAAGDDRGTGDGGGDDGQAGDPEDAESTHDDEIEQMGDDVPCVPVYGLEPDLFTGKREYLGHNNLQPSFRSNGASVRAFDPGEPPEAA